MAEKLSRKLLFSSTTKRPPTGSVTALHCDIPSPLSAIIVAIIRLGKHHTLRQPTKHYYTLPLAPVQHIEHYDTLLQPTKHYSTLAHPPDQFRTRGRGPAGQSERPAGPLLAPPLFSHNIRSIIGIPQQGRDVRVSSIWAVNGLMRGIPELPAISRRN